MNGVSQTGLLDGNGTKETESAAATSRRRGFRGRRYTATRLPNRSRWVSDEWRAGEVRLMSSRRLGFRSRIFGSERLSRKAIDILYHRL